MRSKCDKKAILAVRPKLDNGCYSWHPESGQSNLNALFSYPAAKFGSLGSSVIQLENTRRAQLFVLRLPQWEHLAFRASG